jgi:hydroxymethylpyrimidine kinase/phosphomethylpyrimidine kinase/thiamine-phosphate diphosphorylase
VDDAARARQVLAAGVRTLQLRRKTPAAPDAAWVARLRESVRDAVLACREAGAELFVNDHWQLARELGAEGVHLGQEDLQALGEAGRRALRESGLKLGVSTHSLWELCRAAALRPRYLACGPVWPTLTKAMPWRPQGLDNLAWWCAMAPAPVVAIGGLLEAAQFEQAVRSGADGLCAVRVLGDEPARTVPALQRALRTDPDRDMQLLYIRALASMGERSVPALKELIESPDPRAREVAIRALAGSDAGGVWAWPWPQPRPFP